MGESDAAIEVLAPEPPVAEQRQVELENEASERAEACWKEIQAVARKYFCRIEASIDPEVEQVGRWGNRVQLQAGIRVIPLVKT